MLTNTVISFDMNGIGPSIDQTTVVESAAGVSTKRVVFDVAIGSMKSSLISIADASAFVISIRPAPTSRLPCHA